MIHIAERDTQTASFAKQPGEFVNTWSIDGFVGEGCQPAELGWGTHEKTLPADGAPPRFRLRRGDLSDAPRRLDPGADLDADGRPAAWVPDHAQRVDFDRRLLLGDRGRNGALPADGALRLSSVRRRGAVGA